MAFEGNTWLTYVIFSLIAVVSFLGNVMVIYVFLTRPSYFKQPYNIFIFSLAVTDLTTSIFLVFSRFLYIPPTPKGQLSREIFCRTIWSGVVLFDLTYISIYTALALTIERWLAVVKPLVYRSIEPHHAVKVVVFVWIWGILVNLSTVFRVKFSEVKQQCTWTPLKVANDQLPFLDFVLQTAIPFLAIITLYSHILHAMRKLAKTSAARYKSMKRATVVAFATSAAMIGATIPSRITFMMSKFGIVDVSGLFHFSLVTLNFSSACFNPFLYAVFNPQLKREFQLVFQNLFRLQAGLQTNRPSSSSRTSSSTIQHPNSSTTAF